MNRRELYKTITLMEVESLIHKLVWEFAEQYAPGLVSVNELQSEAHMGFVEAYETYLPGKGQFTTHLHWKVWGRLKSFIRSRSRARRDTEPIIEEIPMPADPMRALREMLTDDAIFVVNISLNPPPSLALALDENPKGRPARKAVSDYLRSIGWKYKRITATFTEIRNAL